MPEADGMNENLLNLTADIVAAHVGHNSVSMTDVPALISNVHKALSSLGVQSVGSSVARTAPAVSLRASVKSDHIVCLFDGKKMKMLKRHLRNEHNMTPAEYRAHWDLAADYPMVASNYALQRRELAVKIGLGRRPNAAHTGARAK